MSQVTTTKPINLYQLGQEIGGNPSLRKIGPEPDGSTVVVAEPTSQATLDAKVAAHVANPSIVAPPNPDDVARATKASNVDRDLATLRQWASDAHAVGAQGANVTQAQQKALFDRMGTFLDRFADYVESRR